MTIKGNIKSRAPGLGKWMLSSSHLSHANCTTWIRKLLSPPPKWSALCSHQSRKTELGAELQGNIQLSTWWCFLDVDRRRQKKTTTNPNTGVLKPQNKKKNIILSHTLLVFCSLLSLLIPAPSVVSQYVKCSSSHNLRCWCLCEIWCLADGFFY